MNISALKAEMKAGMTALNYREIPLVASLDNAPKTHRNYGYSVSLKGLDSSSITDAGYVGTGLFTMTIFYEHSTDAAKTAAEQAFNDLVEALYDIGGFPNFKGIADNSFSQPEDPRSSRGEITFYYGLL